MEYTCYVSFIDSSTDYDHGYYDSNSDRNKWYQSRSILGRASATMEPTFGEFSSIDGNIEKFIGEIELVFEKFRGEMKPRRREITSEEMNPATITQGEKLTLIAENRKISKDCNEVDDDDQSSIEENSISEEQKVFDKRPGPKFKNDEPIKLSEKTMEVNNKDEGKQSESHQGYPDPTLKIGESTPIVVVSDFEKSSPNLGFLKLKTRDREWYFFSMLDKKYGNGARTNRATEKGYWKTTGKDRAVYHKNQIVGMKKTLVYHIGRAPKGRRSNWVMHEYRLADLELERADIHQEAFVLCRVCQKSGPNLGEKNILLFDPGGIFLASSFDINNVMHESKDFNRGTSLTGTMVVGKSVVVSKRGEFPIQRATIFNRHKLFDEMLQPRLKKKCRIGIAFVCDQNAFKIIEENVIIFDPGGVVLSDFGYGKVDILEYHMTRATERMDKHLLDAMYCLANKKICARPCHILIDVSSKILKYVCVLAVCKLLCWGDDDMHIACFELVRLIGAGRNYEILPVEKLIQSITIILSEEVETVLVFRSLAYDHSLGDIFSLCILAVLMKLSGQQQLI